MLASIKNKFLYNLNDKRYYSFRAMKILLWFSLKKLKNNDLIEIKRYKITDYLASIMIKLYNIQLEKHIT